MAGFFTDIKRFFQQADFWDQDENARQRQEWAREDEEERRRREQQAQSQAFNVPSVGSNVVVQQERPKPAAFNFDQPLQKDRGAFGTGFNNSMLQPQQPEIKTEKQTEESRKQQILDKLTEANMERARAEAERGESWFGKTFLNRKAIEERAKTMARNRATTQFQEKYGWNRDPAVLKYGNETMRQAEAEGDRLREGSEKLEKFSDNMDKVAQGIGYVPVAGSVFNLGLTGAEKLAKATGNEAYGKDLEDSRIRVDFGMEPEEFHALDPETQQKLRNLQTLGLAASPLDFLGLGGIAKSGVVSVGKKAAIEGFKKGGVRVATQQALAKAGAQALKETAVPASLGAATSVGAQAYLGGVENIDPFEAAKTGLMVGGTSLLFPSQSLRKAGQSSIDEAAQSGRTIMEEAGDLVKATDEAAEDVTTAAKTGANPEDVAEVPGSRRVETTNGEPAIEVSAGVKSTNAAKVPDVTNPIALAKATDDMAGTGGDVPISDFRNSVDGSQPLQKATSVEESLDDIAARAPTEAVDEFNGQDPRVEVATTTDVQGNPALTTDAQMARQLAEQGIVPDRGDSIAATQEANLEAAAREAADQEVQTTNPASLRERKAFAGTEEDPELAQEILDTIPSKAPLDMEEALSTARNNARSRNPAELIASWSNEVELDQNNPQAWINALEERKVLNALVSEGVPGAREARLNLADSMSRFQSRSGQNLNILKVAYDELDPDMKTDLLIKKLRKAGVDDPDQFRDILLARVERADQAALRVKAIEDEIGDFNRAITTGSATPEARTRLETLNKAKDEALTELYQRNAEVTDYFSQVSPEAPFGQKLANWNRVSMLSSLSGRIFDIASTAGTAGLDTVNRAISALFARGLNGRVGNETAMTALPQAIPSASDLRKAGQTTLESAQGKNQVRDVLAEIQGVETGRSELQSQSRGRFRNMVKAATEAPTRLTQYIEDNEIYRAGRRQADELGLQGDDAELYADSYWAVATSGEKYAAQQEHFKANMLHNNPVSSKIDAVSNVLLNSNSDVGKTTGAILKSVVAPFTRFVGGMTHRTFTDMNVVHNAWQIRKALKNGDTQALADNLAKLTTNTTIGFATATVLAETGVLTTEDANGDSYAGLYFHIGDRYIPVGFAGLGSVPLIVGYGINQALNSDDPTDAFTDVTTDTLSRVLASTGTAGFFGADNALQTAIGGASSAISPDETGANERDFADVIGSTLRQSIPAGLNDVNSILNQIPGLNPTGEAADTKVLNEDGTQNPLGTQLAKLQNTIPGLSQMLPRKDDVPARDFLDRSLKGTRETGEMADRRAITDSLKAQKEELERENIPTTAEKIGELASTGEFDKAIRGAQYRLAELEADESATEASKRNAREDLENYQFGQEYGYVPSSEEKIQARAERGEYKAALEGYKLRLSREEGDPDIPESKLAEKRETVKRFEVYTELNPNPGLVDAYENGTASTGGVGVSDWRDMMDSGDPKIVAYAEKLYNLDKALLEAGAIKKQKYYWKGGGSGRGGRGGRGSSPRFSTDIATNTAGGYTFTPIAPQKADMAQPVSAIPQLEKVADYSRQPKKISVKRGTRV